MTSAMRAESIAKSFTLHNQSGIILPVLDAISIAVQPGEAVVLCGPSGAGKSTLLRILYGNYLPDGGHVFVRHGQEIVDIACATPRRVLEVRRRTLSYVSQFLRVIPRITTLDIVKSPMLARGVDDARATARACAMLERLNLPERLWHLAPSTFSGGEQQRVNIARSFVDPTPVMLLDEPTASLDADNREVVASLIFEARSNGAAIIGIFHDEAVRERIATRLIDLPALKPAA